MTGSLHPLPFKGDLIDYLNLNGRELEWLWRDGEAYIPVRPICGILGIAYQPQHRKLTSADWDSGVTVLVTPDARGRPQEHLCLAYPDFLMWMGMISPGRVKANVREPLRRLRREIREVVAAHYHDRLFSEQEARRFIVEEFQSDFITARPIRMKIARAALHGWSFDQLWRSTSYSRRRIVDEMMRLLQIGALAEPLAGTPFELRSAAPEKTGTDPRQLTLFAGG